MAEQDLPSEKNAAESPLDHAAHEPHLPWPAGESADSDTEEPQEAVLDVGRKLLDVIPPPPARD